MAIEQVSAHTARWCVELTFSDEFSQQGAHAAELGVLVAVADRLMTHFASTIDEGSSEVSNTSIAKTRV